MTLVSYHVMTRLCKRYRSVVFSELSVRQISVALLNSCIGQPINLDPRFVLIPQTRNASCLLQRALKDI